MKKILLVIEREYLSRVRKKSFIVMTILGPLLIAAFYGILLFLMMNNDFGSEASKVIVVDESGFFRGKFKDNKSVSFIYAEHLAGDEKRQLDSGDIDGFLHIPASLDHNKPDSIQYISEKSPSLYLKDYIEQSISKELEAEKMKALGISKEELEKVKTPVNLDTIKPNKESNSSEIATAIGFVAGLFIYIFIFLYGTMVMKGVLEEKTNRIVEVVISSLRPFQLMLGKIIGVALVGLTQFVIWILLSGVLILVISALTGNQINPQDIPNLPEQAQAQSAQINAISSQIFSLPWATLISMFIFYFIGGYFFYSALFAAVGSAVDSETETQQFMLPISMPLVFALMLTQTVVINNPHGQLAIWLSMIPFTSPISMMARIPFEVPVYELLLSMLCMIAGFLLTTWVAARIYRVGILMYGKKPSLKELGKWIFYRG